MTSAVKGDGANGPTRWGIVGAGNISRDFCLALRTRSLHEHKIVAVAARNLECAQQFAQQHGVEKAYGSYESIAADPDVDIVYIGTITTNHVPLSLMMLEAGKHVLCEKPLALSSAGVKKVLEFAQQKNRLFVEGLWSRFFPAYKQLRTELKTGSIGTVKGLTAYLGVDFGWDKPDQEQIDFREIGRGSTLDVGCYLTQLACLVFDNEKPERIHAYGSLHPSGTDKSASVLLCYKDGRTAQLIARSECKLPNDAVIYGTGGTIEIPFFWCPLQLKTPKECFEYTIPTPPEPSKFTNSAGFVHQIEAIRETLLNGQIQTAEITHADSILIAEIQDEILRQLGVTYNTL